MLPTTGKLFDGLPRSKRCKVGISLLIRSIVEICYHVKGESLELPMKFNSSRLANRPDILSIFGMEPFQSSDSTWTFIELLTRIRCIKRKSAECTDKLFTEPLGCVHIQIIHECSGDFATLPKATKCAKFPLEGGTRPWPSHTLHG